MDLHMSVEDWEESLGKAGSKRLTLHSRHWQLKLKVSRAVIEVDMNSTANVRFRVRLFASHWTRPAMGGQEISR